MTNWTRFSNPVRSRLKLSVFKTPGEVAVNLGAETGEVGYVLLTDLAATRHSLDARCEKNVNKLRALFRGRRVPVYYVSGADLAPGFRGQGWGSKMYGAALKAARPAIVVTGGCVGMGSTPDALRVWASLAKTYPSAGFGSTLVLALT